MSLTVAPRPDVIAHRKPISSNADWMFNVDHLTKRFGSLAANDDISLTVEPGEVYDFGIGSR
jgi:hypothetical protein